ncbi:uncharacterized protein [Apostichopus japonicus]|uniref:uncharacterized protein n=1 Tax=Stichopus japonicus TaxID=307972 RepID=UPI003AB61F23
MLEACLGPKKILTEVRRAQERVKTVSTYSMPQLKLPFTCEELHFLKRLTGALECQQASLSNKKQTSFSDPKVSFLDGIAPSETSVEEDSFVQECESSETFEISVMELPHALMPTTVEKRLRTA